MSARTGRWGGIAMTVPCESGRCKETLVSASCYNGHAIVGHRPPSSGARATARRQQSCLSDRPSSVAPLRLASPASLAAVGRTASSRNEEAEKRGVPSITLPPHPACTCARGPTSKRLVFFHRGQKENDVHRQLAAGAWQRHTAR